CRSAGEPGRDEAAAAGGAALCAGALQPGGRGAAVQAVAQACCGAPVGQADQSLKLKQSIHQSELAVQAARAVAFANAALEEFSAGNGLVRRAIQVDEEAVALAARTLAVALLHPCDLPALQGCFAGRIQQGHQFLVALVQLLVGLAVDLVQAVKPVEVIDGLVAVGVGQGQGRQRQGGDREEFFQEAIPLWIEKAWDYLGPSWGEPSPIMGTEKGTATAWPHVNQVRLRQRLRSISKATAPSATL